MATLHADYEPFAWWLARERIGQDLRERYSMPEELPAQLLKLAEKLDAVVGNQLPQEAPRNWSGSWTLSKAIGCYVPAENVWS